MAVGLGCGSYVDHGASAVSYGLGLRLVRLGTAGCPRLLVETSVFDCALAVIGGTLHLTFLGCPIALLAFCASHATVGIGLTGRVGNTLHALPVWLCYHS
jgi:hypothetical protein